jgi:hypothetical protein
MFPEAEHRPSGVFKQLVSLPIPLHVPAELLGPEATVGARGGVVLRTTVPEAAVEEDGDPGASENEVGPAADVWDWGLIDAIAQPKGVNGGPEAAFGLGVTAAVRLEGAAHGG